jgi:UDP-N-acetylmuramoyl-tripeptide--D-alanyl-D-alanine ligase
LEEHDRVGEVVARLGIDRLVVVGEEARGIARGATREGVEPEHVVVVGTPAEALGDVRAHARPGDLVLVKGSRVVGLEWLAEALRRGMDRAGERGLAS